jgi:hypothetical protein
VGQTNIVTYSELFISRTKKKFLFIARVGKLIFTWTHIIFIMYMMKNFRGGH